MSTPSTPLDRAIAQWRLSRVEVVSVGLGSTVALAEWDGTPVVLKVSATGEARRREAAALRAWNGQGAARLLAADDHGALLIEFVADARTVAEAATDDDASTALIGRAIAAIQQHPGTSAPVGSTGLTPVSSALPDIASLSDVLRAAPRPQFAHEGSLAGVPEAGALIDQANETLARLTSTTVNRVVLHGDLHHTNVLVTADGEPVVIDPHGWIGDPCLEPASLLANPRDLIAGEPDLLALTLRRVEILCGLTGLDPARVLDWALVAGIVAEVWALEDHGMVHGAPLRLAAALNRHRGDA